MSTLARHKDPFRIGHFVALERLGGVEASALALANTLFQQEEWEAAMYCDRIHPVWRGQWPSGGVQIVNHKRWGGVRIPSAGPFRNWKLSLQLRRAPIDVAFFWNLVPERGVIRTLRRNGVRLIYLERGAAWLANWAPGRPQCEQMDLIIANSNAAKRMLQLRWQVASPVSVVPNPLRTNAAPEHPQTSRARDPAEPLRIGVASRLIPIKGIPIILYALAELHHAGVKAELEIAGEGPDRNKLHALSQSLGLSSFVRFLGSVSDIASFYQGIDVAVCPSLREPFGLTSIEAQAWGVPVIVTRVDGLPETIKEGGTGVSLTPRVPLGALQEFHIEQRELPPYVYDPSSDSLTPPAALHPTDLAEALTDLAVNEEKRRKMGTEGSRYVLSTHDLSTYANRIATLTRTTFDHGIRPQP